MFQLVLFISFAAGLAIFSLRLAGKGRKRSAELVAAIGLFLAMFGVNAWHEGDKKAASEKLSGALVIMEDRLREGDTTAALGIADKGVRLFAASQARFDDAALQLWRFSVETGKTPQNQQPGRNTEAMSSSTSTPPPGVAHP